jgi:uncharacterized protein (TIGR03067 family)
VRLFLGVLAAASLLAAAGVRAQDARKDQEALQGTWVMTAKEFMGKKASEDEIKKLGTRIVLKGDTVTVSTLDAGEYVVVSEATFKLDPATKPKSMDLTVTGGPSKGKSGLAIYELDGDTLKVCWAIDEEKRPTRFAGPKDSEWIFVVYKREKK